jgi:hypothetical protein
MNTRPPPPEGKPVLDAWREASQATPSPALDAAILDAARAELAERRQEKSRLRSRPWWFRWAVPLSATAVAVLGISLSLRVADEDELRLRSSPLPAAATSPAADLPTAAPAGSTERLETRELFEKAGKPAKAESSAKARRSARALTERAEDLALPASSSPLPSAGAGGNVARDEHYMTGAKSAAEAPKVIQQPAASDEVAAKTAKRVAVPAAAAPMPSVSPPAATVGSAAMERRAEPEALPSRRDAASLAPAAAAPREMRRALKSEAAPGRAEPATAEAWIQELRSLLQRGDEAQVLAGLQRFKARYPGFPLPPDLAALQEAN